MTAAIVLQAAVLILIELSTGTGTAGDIALGYELQRRRWSGRGLPRVLSSESN